MLNALLGEICRRFSLTTADGIMAVAPPDQVRLAIAAGASCGFLTGLMFRRELESRGFTAEQIEAAVASIGEASGMGASQIRLEAVPRNAPDPNTPNPNN